MKTILNTLPIIAFCCFLSQIAISQIATPQVSQRAGVSQTVGISEISVDYSRPSVNGREIWGKLVPYGMNNLGFGTAIESPWRAGANENTRITFSHDVMVEKKAIKAGTYGLHMVVEESGEVTIIFSHNSTSWGSYFYEPAEDALRVKVQSTTGEHHELLTYDFSPVTSNTATLNLRWGKKIIPIQIQVPVVDIMTADIQDKLRDSPGFNRQTWEQAAGYLVANDGDLDLALSYIDAAIAGQFFSQKTFNNLSLKSQILMKKGKLMEAQTVMDEALELGTALQVHGYGRQLIGLGMTDKALEVFQFNAEKYHYTWPTNYGLARAYSAKGDYKTALQHLKKAYENAPAQLNKDRVQANIEKLERSEDIN